MDLPRSVVVGHAHDMSVQVLAMILLLVVIDSQEECPRVCECKWKSGKESVVCTNSNLTQVPRQLDSGTQVLDLTGNALLKVDTDEFYNASLLNLQRVYLSRCKIRSVDRYAFRNIINLVELDLSYNELQAIPSHSFEFISELRELKLNGNPIVKILNNSFKMVPRLTKLDLSECRITLVEVRTFQGLENSLEWLKLDKNKISNVKSVSLVQLGNLHGLELAGNPWNCSCGLRPLREWILRHNIPHTITPSCKTPHRLSGRHWDKLDLDEYACAPRVEVVRGAEVGVEEDNVTLSCALTGTPDPTVSWLKKNHVIANLSGVTTGPNRKLYIVQVTGGISSLTILSVEVLDSGLYTCRAENKAGRAEVTISLSISVRPEVPVWSVRLILATVAVVVLSVITLVLLVICMCNFRKRHSRRYHQHATHVVRTDVYEMNHKSDNAIKYANNYNSAKHDVSMGPAKARNGQYRGVPSTDEECETVGRADGRVWKKSEDSTRSADRHLSPDLHIPRQRQGVDVEPCSGDAAPPSPGPENTRAYTAAELLTSTPGVKSHIMHKQVLGTSGGTIYTSVQPGSDVESYPDLLDLDKSTANNNTFCTLPRKRAFKNRRPRHSSCGSESPLLPGSSGGSDRSDSSYSSNRRFSADGIKNASLPTSPRNLTPTPLLNLLDNTQDIYKTLSPTGFDYKSSELEKFLKEYRNLQEQLYKMKESCENLKEDNLRFNESRAKTGESVFSVSDAYKAGTIEPMYSVTQHIINDTNNLGTVLSDALLHSEDNNNPKSILKPPCVQKSVLDTLDFKSDSYWMSRSKLLNTSQDGDLFQS